MSRLHVIVTNTVIFMWALYKASCFRLTESSSSEEKAVLFSSPRSPISLLSKLGQSLSRKRNPKVRSHKQRHCSLFLFIGQMFICYFSSLSG